MVEPKDRKLAKNSIEKTSQTVLLRGVVVFVACAFGILTFLVKATPVIAIDLEITRSFQLITFPFFGWLMAIISWAGFGPQVIFITGAIILAIYILDLRWEALMALMAVLFSTTINFLVKELIQRPRPVTNLVNVVNALSDYSFPSGHVMYYLSFLGFIGFLVFNLMKPSVKRTLLLVLIGFPVALIGVSRIYLGQHWASDVLGAYLLGSLDLILIIYIYQWGKTRFFVR